MTPNDHAQGGAPVAVLNRLDTWEANTVLNLRLWCEGPEGQEQVWSEFRRALSGQDASDEWRAFQDLISTVISHAKRPLVRHDVGCSCVGSDECIFLNLVRTASAGHLNDAALIATLLAGPAHAEHIAVLAGRVGACARRIHTRDSEPKPNVRPNNVRLH